MLAEIWEYFDILMQDDPRRCVQDGLETVELEPAGTVEDAVTGSRSCYRWSCARAWESISAWDSGGIATQTTQLERQERHGCEMWFPICSSLPEWPRGSGRVRIYIAPVRHVIISLNIATVFQRAPVSAAQPILHLSSHDMHRREHSALLRLCQYVFLHVKPPWQLQIVFICCFKYLEFIAKSSVVHSNSSCF